MKLFLKFIFLPLLVAYAIISFIKVDINFMNWSETVRIILVVLMLVLLAMYTFIDTIFFNDISKNIDRANRSLEKLGNELKEIKSVLTENGILK